MGLQFLQHHRHAAGIAEILHQVLPDGMQLTSRGIGAPISKSVERQRHPDPASQRQQMHHRVGRSAQRGIGEDRVLKAFARSGCRTGFRSSSTISTMRRPVICASAMRRASTAGSAALVGRASPIASHRDAMVDAVPMVMQTPADRLMPDSVAMKSQRHLARAHGCRRISRHPCPSRGPAPPFAVQHRTRRHHDRRQIDRGRPHQLPRRGLVAAAQQDHAVDAIGADRFPPHPSTTGCETASPWASSASRPGLITGNSTGKPPASQTPRLTPSASSRRPNCTA
jgi:hypothetical protein